VNSRQDPRAEFHDDDDDVSVHRTSSTNPFYSSASSRKIDRRQTGHDDVLVGFRFVFGVCVFFFYSTGNSCLKRRAARNFCPSRNSALGSDVMHDGKVIRLYPCASPVVRCSRIRPLIDAKTFTEHEPFRYKSSAHVVRVSRENDRVFETKFWTLGSLHTTTYARARAV